MLHFNEMRCDERFGGSRQDHKYSESGEARQNGGTQLCPISGQPVPSRVEQERGEMPRTVDEDVGPHIPTPLSKQ